MLFVGQNACQSGHIVVIDKGHKMLAAVNTPLVGSVLAVERMGDLKHIHRIKAGEYTLVAFIIGAAMQHFIIYN